jgi:taurine dioxygenase
MLRAEDVTPGLERIEMGSVDLMQSGPVNAGAAVNMPVITPATGAIGAWISGFDLLARDHSPDIKHRLVRALHEHGVLFFRLEGDFGPEDHKRFGRMFGELRESFAAPGTDPVVSLLDNQGVASARYGTDQWHTDVSVTPEPPLAASLRALTLPDVGGDTMWASMYAVYETLSSKMQRFLDGLEAVHSTETLLNARPAAREDKLFKKQLSAVHPVVIRDPVTRKPALYVNKGYTERIVGLSDQESASVLKMLFNHVNTPEFHVRLKWDLQTLVIWEERVTQHRAVNDYTGRRILNRVTVKGGPMEAYGKAEATNR